MRENDSFVLSKPAEATVIGERRSVVLPEGTVVVVVLVLGDSNSPAAYEVEAYMPNEDIYALATIEACDIS
jgi:hypothetical protein